ncbi:MAG: class I SAM-dependent DNA methyltransferase [Acidimicrobiales bacterium]
MDELEDVNPAIEAALGLGGDVVAIRKYYADWAVDYDRDVGADEYAVPATTVDVLRALGRERGLDFDPTSQTTVVVDAGYGTGLVGSALAEAGIDGLDLSEDMIGVARQRGIYRRLESGVDLNQPIDRQWARSADLVTVCGVFTGHAPYTLDSRGHYWAYRVRHVAA